MNHLLLNLVCKKNIDCVYIFVHIQTYVCIEKNNSMIKEPKKPIFNALCSIYFLHLLIVIRN